MKRLITILFLINTSITYSQEVKLIYLFKKELKNKNGFPFYESDSLVLYNNGEFYQKKYFWNHEVMETEHVGLWSIENNILELSIISKEKYSEAEKFYCSLIRHYKIKKRRIVPKRELQCGFKPRKLKCLLGE